MKHCQCKCSMTCIDTLYVNCCFDAHTSRAIIDYHEMEKSYETGDLFFEFFSLVSWIASIKLIVLVICNEDF